jgi:2-methylcitrate dehydratase PrpD
MSVAFFEAMLGAAADLDPLDVGPAHLALPATVAAGVGAQLTQAPSERVADAVLAGMEAGARLRQAIFATRPGVGFHSAGTFGLFAAAAASARILELDSAATAAALAIALTRASGLAVNNTSTRIGLTHFGWAAAHGLEAAWLASNGLSASMQLEPILKTLFPGGRLDFSAMSGNGVTCLPDRIVFKAYPCNIYLNLVVSALAAAEPRPIKRISLQMPPIRHLDQPRPLDVRAARNSAQAVAAIAALYPPTYRSFTEDWLRLDSNDSFWAMVDATSVLQQPDWPTGLDQATIVVKAEAQGGGAIGGGHRQVGELKAWSHAHAGELTGDLGDTGWVDEIYGRDYLHGHAVVQNQVFRGGAV